MGDHGYLVDDDPRSYDTDGIADPDQDVFAMAADADAAVVDELVAAPDDRRSMGVAGHSSIGVRMMRIAWSQRGVCETGQNGGVPMDRYVRAFIPGSGPLPWCAFFVSWCFLQTTRKRPPWSNPGYVPTVQEWAKRRRKLVNVPIKGDLFGIGGQHMGIVVQSTRRPQRFVTIEGNTSSGCVRSLERPWSGHWFVRI